MGIIALRLAGSDYDQTNQTIECRREYRILRKVIAEDLKIQSSTRSFVKTLRSGLRSGVFHKNLYITRWLQLYDWLYKRR